MPHTGDKCTAPGLFECPICNQTVRMLGNPDDHFPPCPKCKSGVHYNEIILAKLVQESVEKKKAVAANND